MLTSFMGVIKTSEISKMLRFVKFGILFTIFLQYTYYFLWVIVNIRFYHNYEFKRIRNTLFAQISFLLLMVFESVYFLIYFIYNDTNPMQSGCGLDGNWAEFINFSGCYILNLPSLLIALVIIRFKSSQDILQGVSKLDYFLKASVFQKYKGGDPR